MYGAVKGATVDPVIFMYGIHHKILPYFIGGKDCFRTNQGRLLEGV